MDLKKMLKTLLARGETQTSIAAAVNTNQPTINRILKGSEPRYGLGKRIEQFYHSSYLSSSVSPDTDK